jgi:hypothetical protein
MADPYCPETPGSATGAGDPEDRTGYASNLCSIGPRPVIMTGLFRLLLTEHFASRDNIEHTPFQDRLWKATVDTGILIEDSTVWTPSITGSRPAVIVKRNKWTSLKKGINNWHGLTPEGFDEYTKFWRGSHTLFCIAREGAEAEVLAAETYRYMLHYAPVFRQYFDLMLFEMVEVGELNELEEEEGTYTVPITVMYGWAESWVLRLHTPKLKRIALSSLFPPEVACF